MDGHSPSPLAIMQNDGGAKPSALTDHDSSQIALEAKKEATSPMTELTPRPPSLTSAENSSQRPPTLSPRQSHTGDIRTSTRHPATHTPRSPCFVHSLLDQGASLADWLYSAQGSNRSSSSETKARSSSSSDKAQTFVDEMIIGEPEVALAKGLGLHNAHGSTAHPAAPPSDDWEIDSSSDDEGNSFTKRLAETAVGVRELSKQLGRARVRTNIQSVLIVTKARDNRLIKLTSELAIYLMKKRTCNNTRGLIVYVDKQLKRSKRFDAAGMRDQYPEFFVPLPRRRTASSTSLPSMTNESLVSGPTAEEGQLRYWTSEMCSKSPHWFDFVVTLGGDGTVLFTSWLFQRIVPPVLPFALGSLGFLTNFDFADYEGVMDSAIDNGIRVNLRMRFTCTVYRAVAPKAGKGRKAIKKAETGEILMKNIEEGGWEALEGGAIHSTGGSGTKDKEIMCFTTRPVESFEVLNDLVVDRGPSPYVSLLELFGDEHHMTTVQADGLTVSTPTGSTAYSLSAGGSLVHPEIPALLITPICPHTLSFRPMLLPDTMELRICVPYNSRSTAWASFDGRGRVELKQGDHIKVTASKYPFPTVCADKQSTDWFHAISRTLKWNERERQKSFVVVEEGPTPARRQSTVDSSTGGTDDERSEYIPVDEEDELDEDGEEDEFDIDDLSGEASSKEATDETSPSPHETKPDQGHSSDPFRESPGSGLASPDRFADAHPHPPSLHPRHLISDAASKIQHAPSLQAHSNPDLGNSEPVFLSSRSRTYHHPPRELYDSDGGRDGHRDHIRAPESTFHSNKSQIPRDRDIEAESMLTSNGTPSLGGVGSMLSKSHSHSTVTHSTLTPRRPRRRPARSASARRPNETTRPRRGSLDGFVAARHAFAAWGLDETDSNASDSDP
ncbi:uncharacterized protein EI90DRAFT_3123125 [Cantharellus anzutake]|uniref:uncharacterized protein n=1 Tax=Cantharellus anzutake TaxID=1750568 RepID=UPI0019071E7B|nr:uncharacterized protein EI90DRAFT_3123125 [Cantharellus anzutake]KAF8332048.1 hypothetical protein EI90DRAFT_3123125 [Cantharellus anzutake]